MDIKVANSTDLCLSSYLNKLHVYTYIYVCRSCYLRNAASILRFYNYHCFIKSDKTFEVILFLNVCWFGY